MAVNTNRTGIIRKDTITMRRVNEPMKLSNLSMTTTTPMASDKFGTITKRYVNGRLAQSEGPINRTFEIGSNSTFKKSTSSIFSTLQATENPLNNTFDIDPNATLLIKNRKSTSFIKTPNQSLMQFQQDTDAANVNSNTITKNRRRTFNIDSGCMMINNSTDGQTSDCITIVSASEGATTDYDTDTANSYTDNESFAPGMVSNGFAKYGNSDTEESVASLSGKNYPTISRNTTKTLIRKSLNQGQSVMKKNSRLVANSNDDLLTSDSSEISSTQSNLSTTSSISGRSEPNLLRLRNATNGQRPKILARPSIQSPLSTSKLPNKSGMFSTGNASIVRNAIASRLPNPINNFGGSVGSLPQSGIGRASSQV